MRLIAAAQGMPDGPALQLGADVNTTLTQHAALHVDDEIGVGRVGKRFARHGFALRRHAVGTQQGMEGPVRLSQNRLGRIVARQPRQFSPPRRLKFGCMSNDPHPIHGSRPASRHRPGPALDTYQAQAAPTDRVKASIVAQGWQINAHLAHRLEQRQPLRKAVCMVIDDEGKRHAFLF